jgi:PIN domain nuclease of toxin-antitoxin system
MRLLLDTHTFLWFIAGSKSLSQTARDLIEDVANEKFVSVASVWEIAIKHSIGKLPLAAPFSVLITQQLALNGFDLLPITVSQLSLLVTLPFHHRDPFDRLIIAQSLTDNLFLVSADAKFDAYGVQRLW